MTTDQKIALLREAMHREGISAYLVPSADPHQSEYVADHWKSREWLSGFSGSAGILAVTPDHAGLWTDSRYFLQAEKELAGSGVVLHRQVVPHAPEHVQWLAENLPQGSTLGLDGRLFSLGQLRYLTRNFHHKNIEINSGLDLVAGIWHNRPPLPASPVFEMPPDYTGHSREEKLARIRATMATRQADAYLVSTLDDIAWTLNIRAADVDFNPLCISYLIIGEKTAHWFVPEGKVSEALRQTLLTDGVVLHPYEETEQWLQRLPKGEKIFVDTTTVSVRLFQAIPDEQTVQGDNLVQPMKALKTEGEIAQLRRAMRKDGAALTRLFRWLETELRQRPVAEYEVASKISELRAAQGEYIGESFGAIVGYNANGAIVHYGPTESDSALIRPEGILLFDSGGQYLHGTTDITRTVALGEPSAEQIRANTAVLKGHIALAAAWFPKGTRGVQLDTLARMHLWREAKNYGHGTGHGVGFFLSVHEGPQGISPSATTSRGLCALEPGMLTSNEPGYYEPGQYGIRIENLILCVEAAQTNSGRFFRFETLSFFPIDLRLIDPALLDPTEKEWLNDYHAQVLRELAPLLATEEAAWLEERCRPV
ncbi:MAG: aminopeptidase P family protein [Saprospiraceae bacterium]|nr:aminopeptidase P family protein [Saprospiraceae bacterium]